MHSYHHHIGDFNSATRHLTHVERSLYRDLIELYYDTEKPLISDLDQLNRRLLVRTIDEKDALKNVLSEFFELIGGSYVHHRCEEEILKYRENTAAKARAGRASAAAKRKRAQQRRAAKTNTCSTPVQQVFNEPSTEGQQSSTNQEPRTNNQSKEPCTTEMVPVDDSGKKGYSADFEMLWKTKPKREGKNSKHDAFKAYKASLARGNIVADIADGLKRYTAYCEAKGWIGTARVSMMATFFGPSDMHTETWDLHPSSAVQPWQKIPTQDDELWPFAKEHGFSDPNPGEHSYHYRNRLTTEAKQRQNAS